MRVEETATAGPRTVPVRSGIAGGKAQECSRPPRPSNVLRAGTARARWVGVKKFSVFVTEILLADNVWSFCVNRRARVNARINEAFCPMRRRETGFI